MSTYSGGHFLVDENSKYSYESYPRKARGVTDLVRYEQAIATNKFHTSKYRDLFMI
jgi:hypothetical protein